MAGEQWAPLWADGWLPSTPTSLEVFMSLQGPKPASHKCIPLVRFSPQRRLRSVMKTTSGLFVSYTKESVVGESQETLYVSPLSLIRAPLTDSPRDGSKEAKVGREESQAPCSQEAALRTWTLWSPSPQICLQHTQACALSSPPQEAPLTLQSWHGCHMQ